ncbi:MAG: diheme cytochrome c-553 [Ferruginibacter sp.]
MKKKILFGFGIALSFTTLIISCNSNETKKDASVNTTTMSNADLIKRGGYLVSIAGCDDCHTPKKFGPMGPEPDMDRRLSGYRSNVPFGPVDTNVIKQGWVLANGELTGWAGPWGASFAANLTSDATGIGGWTEEQFKKAITEGKWKGMDGTRSLLPPMPWQNFKNFTDEDVKAIFTFLKSIKPVENIEPPVKTFAELK